WFFVSRLPGAQQAKAHNKESRLSDGAAFLWQISSLSILTKKKQPGSPKNKSDDSPAVPMLYWP
ncbi:hypothetical protein, partial [Desulfovibrio piger]|uniref:hypothetical protein n=1 Tax=Desulfovibrio piger TaxID=901 RepID=UPI0026F3725E